MRANNGWQRLAAVLLCGAVFSGAANGCGNGDDDGASSVLRILVTNDDGVTAEGIDALVNALVADARNAVTVCAPSGNRSGSGDMTGPSERCGDLTAGAATTASGVSATAVDGCPADAVLYALDTLYPADAPPDVVLSGINEGQNISAVVATQFSGTVGAAKTAARSGVPALAASQGVPEPGGQFDYASGVDAVLTWLESRRSALAAGTLLAAVDNLNVPSCASGSIRGTQEGIPLADDATGALDAQDCTSTLEDPADDVEAFVNGFTTVSDVPLE